MAENKRDFGKNDPRLLMVTDTVDEVKDVSYILRKDFAKYLTHCFEADAISRINSLKPDLLILAFLQIDTAEKVNDMLKRNIPADKMPYTLLLCTQSEAARAYQLYREDVVDYFVADRPLVDPYSLVMAVTEVFKQKGKREKLSRELGELDQFMRDMMHKGKSQILEGGPLMQFPKVMESAIKALSERLIQQADAEGKISPVKISDELSRFNHQQLESQKRKIDSLVSQQRSWYEALKSGYDEHLEAIELEPNTGEPLSLLLVDDDDFYRESLELMLGDYDLEITGVASVDEAAEYLKQNVPDIVLLDYQMPEHNGIELLKTLRNDVGTRDLPVIMLTGFHTRDIVLQSIQSGASEFIVKPGDQETIVHKIELLTKRKLEVRS